MGELSACLPAARQPQAADRVVHPDAALLCAHAQRARPGTAAPHAHPAAAVYPPQDPKELASAAEALATSCELLKDECPPSGSGSAEEAAAAAATALLAPLEAVQQAHRELAAELAAAAAGDASAAAVAAAENGAAQ